MVRCFIGIFVPDNLKDKIIKVQEDIKNLEIDCKPVEKENLHVSLSFLGEIENTKIDEIASKLDDICKRYEKFEVNITGLKLIPSKSYIRVMALDVTDSILGSISKNIKNEIGGDVKPAHLTLCRVKNIRSKQKVLEQLNNINFDIGNFTVSSINLIKSELNRTGPVYTTVHESKLL